MKINIDMGTIYDVKVEKLANGHINLVVYTKNDVVTLEDVDPYVFVILETCWEEEYENN